MKVNFYERIWPKKEVKRMYKSNKFDMPEDDSDPDKKMFSMEQRKAQFEKKLMWAALMIGILVWVFYAQDKLLEYCEWPLEAPLPVNSRKRR